MNIYRFTEYNDWEGESWHFYMYIEEELKVKLDELLRNLDLSETYELSTETYEKDEVDVLVKHTECGYLDFHNWSGTFTSFPEESDFEDDDPFYKGGIERYCVNEGD